MSEPIRLSIPSGRIIRALKKLRDWMEEEGFMEMDTIIGNEWIYIVRRPRP